MHVKIIISLKRIKRNPCKGHYFLNKCLLNNKIIKIILNLKREFFFKKKRLFLFSKIDLDGIISCLIEINTCKGNNNVKETCISSTVKALPDFG